MKLSLRLLAFAVFVGANLLWLATGANHGWTKTHVSVNTLDEITGITAISYERRFIPGIDFLGAVVVVTAGLASASFFIGNNTKKTKTAA
jgi:hypothetical protein